MAKHFNQEISHLLSSAPFYCPSLMSGQARCSRAHCLPFLLYITCHHLPPPAGLLGASEFSTPACRLLQLLQALSPLQPALASTATRWARYGQVPPTRGNACQSRRLGRKDPCFSIAPGRLPLCSGGTSELPVPSPPLWMAQMQFPDLARSHTVSG